MPAAFTTPAERAAVATLPLPCLGHVHETPRVGHLVSCDGHGKAQLSLRQRGARASAKVTSQSVRAGSLDGATETSRSLAGSSAKRARAVARASVRAWSSVSATPAAVSGSVCPTRDAAASLHHHNPFFGACGDIALEPDSVYAPPRAGQIGSEQLPVTSHHPPWSARTRASDSVASTRARIRHGGFRATPRSRNASSRAPLQVLVRHAALAHPGHDARPAPPRPGCPRRPRRAGRGPLVATGTDGSWRTNRLRGFATGLGTPRPMHEVGGQLGPASHLPPAPEHDPQRHKREQHDQRAVDQDPRCARDEQRQREPHDIECDVQHDRRQQPERR